VKEGIGIHGNELCKDDGYALEGPTEGGDLFVVHDVKVVECGNDNCRRGIAYLLKEVIFRGWRFPIGKGLKEIDEKQFDVVEFWLND